MKVLLALSDAPYPPRSGRQWRDWQLVNLLRRAGHELHVVIANGAATPMDASAGVELGALAASVVFVDDHVERHAAGDAVVRQAREAAADAVVLRSFWRTAAPRLKAAGHLVVADCADDTVQLLRDMSMSSGLRKLGQWAKYRAARRIQGGYLPACDEVWISTQAGATAMGRDQTLRRTLVVPNLYDVPSVPDYSDRSGCPGTMLFVADFSREPNAAAAAVLLDDILPDIRSRVADVTITFVGDGLTEELGARARRAGCSVVEGVEAVDDYYAWHAVVVVPVAHAAEGMSAAIEALSYGRCVAGLTPALKGLPAAVEPPFVSAATPGELASALSELLCDSARRHLLARRAREYAEQRLSWRTAERVFEQSVLAGAGRPAVAAVSELPAW
jgi:glycosyltransferase involved in cell wall biosynthesis